MLYPIYSLNVAHANDYAEADEFVEVSSGLLIIYGGGTMLGPLVAGYLMDMIGSSGLFVAIGGAFAIYATYAFYRSTRRAIVTEEERSEFQPIPFAKAQTPQIYEIDPRSEPRRRRRRPAAVQA